MTVAEQILKRRKELGMKHATFIRKLSENGVVVNRQMVYNWDTGRTQVDFEIHPTIQEVLAFALDYTIVSKKTKKKVKSKPNGVHKN